MPVSEGFQTCLPACSPFFSVAGNNHKKTYESIIH